MYQQIRDTMLRCRAARAPGVAFPDYYAVTRDMVTTLMSQGAHPVYMERISGLGADAVAHATTVAHLSLDLGLRLESYLIQQRARLAPQHAQEVVNLGVAGMLHDIGKMKLPEALQQRCEIDAPSSAPDDEDARAQWESHPRLGYDMLRGGIESSAAAAVLHHHQHFDGTGFPRRRQARRPGQSRRARRRARRRGRASTCSRGSCSSRTSTPTSSARRASTSAAATSRCCT